MWVCFYRRTRFPRLSLHFHSLLPFHTLSLSLSEGHLCTSRSRGSPCPQLFQHVHSYASPSPFDLLVNQSPQFLSYDPLYISYYTPFTLYPQLGYGLVLYYQINNSLPEGVSLDPVTGTISGTIYPDVFFFFPS